MSSILHLDSSGLQSALLAKTYTVGGSDIDLLADCATLTSSAHREPVRRIRVPSGGVVACYLVKAPTTKVLITYQPGDVDDLQLVKIGGSGDGTTATEITGYW